jgi:chromosome segregation ATPase
MRWLFLVLILFSFTMNPGWLQAKESNKSVCKKYQKQLKEAQEELEEIEANQAKFDKELILLRKEWEDQSRELGKLSGCSEGNSDNTPECETILGNIRETGGLITYYKKERGSLTPRRVKIENKILTAQSNLTNFQCPK